MIRWSLDEVRSHVELMSTQVSMTKDFYRAVGSCARSFFDTASELYLNNYESSYLGRYSEHLISATYTWICIAILSVFSSKII